MSVTDFHVLVVEDETTQAETYVSNAVQRLMHELEAQNVRITRSYSFCDARIILQANTPVDCLLLSANMHNENDEEYRQAERLIRKLHTRQAGVPVFLIAEREKTTRAMSSHLMEMVDEFVWIVEDTADFIAGRIEAAIRRYRKQMLPPLMDALMRYGAVKEYSWAAPGHQGGIGFTKSAVGRVFFDYYGENLFRTDMGIERASLGSLLDHTGAFGDSEKYAAGVFGAHQTYNVVVGSSGSNRTIMQSCIAHDDIVLIDRNCHKSIEQGLILTGAVPVYMVPTRNRYGIIGPIHASSMKPKALAAAVEESSLVKQMHARCHKCEPVYAVVTNCTYDGLCYNAKKAKELLEESTDILHFDEAWYGYARFNGMYEDHFAMHGDPAEHEGATVFATHSTHKLLNGLSQSSYIHVREGRKNVNPSMFNQAYMMHTTTSPLYSIVASNDITAAMMSGESGESLTQEVIQEAVDFRRAVARIWREHANHKDWFFKPWNPEYVQVTEQGEKEWVLFEDAPVDVLTKDQNCWRLKPEDTWHGFDLDEENWCMLDPIKVSLLAPGMGDDGNLLESGVPAALVTQYLTRFGIVPTRTTDFQIMFLFSMGITRGKWGTLLNTLIRFKEHYDSGDTVREVLPDLYQAYPEKYENMTLKALGDEMFAFLKSSQMHVALDKAYTGTFSALMKPRDAYEKIVQQEVELIPSDKLGNRIAANSLLPYPPGIPMIMSGEAFGAQDECPAIQYLAHLEDWDRAFPGFEHVTEGAEVKDGKYHVLCVNNRRRRK